VGVDIISCGTGKRDRRIANPGPYQEYLGYGLLSSRGLVFTGNSRIFFSDGVLNVAVKEGLFWSSLQLFHFHRLPLPLICQHTPTKFLTE
jgi:hypothetical protein